jgi:hypothetical protein
MKILWYGLVFLFLNSLGVNALGACASWMNCNNQNSEYYRGAEWNYNPMNSSLNRQDWSSSGSIWRDEYATADPRLMPKEIKSTGKNIFIFSPKMRQWGAYNSSGELIAFGRANGGDSTCPDIGGPCHTPKGLYTVYRKGTSSCISHSFPVGKGGAKMPYCMFFHNGYSIHGSPYLSLHNGSHGCIRVTVESAQWLSSNFINTGTKVLVLPY